jgi:hypothetical protein
VRITVGIGPRLLESVDGGRTWTEAARTVAAPTEPSLRGVRDDLTLRVPTGSRTAAIGKCEWQEGVDSVEKLFFHQR